MKKIISYPLIALTLLFIAACSGANDSPESITKHFVESTYKGDSKAVIESLDFGKEGDDPEVKEMISGKIDAGTQEAKSIREKNGGIASFTIDNVEYTNEDKTRAKVKFTVVFKKNDASDGGVMNTIKTDKGWKVRI